MTTVGSDDRGQHADGRCLACAVRPEQPEDGAGGHIEGDPVGRHDIAEAFAEALHHDGCTVHDFAQRLRMVKEFPDVTQPLAKVNRRRKLGAVSSQAARQAWRAMQRLLFEGESHGRMATACRLTGGPPSVVKALMHLSPDEPRPMRDLADHWGCDASYVTSVADGLEEQGLAERRPHPTDRRIKTLVLTPKGAEVRAKVVDLLSEPPPSFGALTDAEQAELRDLLTKLAEADQVLGSTREGQRIGF